MSVTAHWYGVPLVNMFNGNNQWDWDSSNIRISLHTSAYTPDVDTHDFWSDVTSEVAGGGGYTTGGQTLAGTTVTYDTGTNEVRLDATDISWSSASFTARYAVAVANTGTSATSPVICYVDFGGDETVSSGTFTITWDSTGVCKGTVA